MKLWGGRFAKETDQLTDHFNSSISFDQRLYKQDIIGSIAHVAMLGAQNIISMAESDAIINGLNSLLEDIEKGDITFNEKMEDIHMNIEALLISRIGDVAKKMHTGRSRNDQVALDVRLYTRDEIITLKVMLKELMQTVIALAKDHTNTIMPGYTHLQRAQPITFAHHLMAYFEMFKRDFKRLEFTYENTNFLPLGSGALATTTYPLDRDAVAKSLDFNGICENSIDGVSDRDFCLDLLYTLSTLMMHLSRFSEEIILWSSHEFHFIELDDAYSTGSSIMPQKKNPDIAELVRGKTGRVYGNLMSLLTTMKGLPLAYNKDMQEDKERLFDSIDTLKMCLPIFTQMIKTMRVCKTNMYTAASGGFTNATDAADYLVKKGLAFRDAHEVIGKLVLHCVTTHTTLEELPLETYQMIHPIFDEDIYEAISLKTCVNERQVKGGPSEKAVTAHIKSAADWLQ
ncbi:argininosuccinate lyase [Cellulosilyticum lentocellum]|uniref:Argininosuccinate lyase n=1 Tax=Cellulosilyticum lentocellum (strain ATCC 49066 / DSM 5427 / NCIMB 11756 / RHM5) TaxID=642492 RepID=F2JGT7_CELLD|nr:argininosuccinate lyase [Cellulosilyticum lentocellum]ADZ84179.1 argininosuccinate lyase [Cellulosilyticum lentocellum DSM 5427]